MIRISIFLFSLVLLTTAIDENAFQRNFNGTGLTQEQISELTEVYNNGTKKSTAKKSVLNFLKSEIEDKKIQKKVRSKFLKVWKDDLLLRNLYEESIANIDPLISEEMKTEIERKKAEADKVYKGDFAKSTLDVVRFIDAETPADQKAEITEKLNKPLKRYSTSKKLKKLKNAISTFQFNATENSQ